MANINSINGNPIVIATSGIADGAVTDAKLAQTGGVLDSVDMLNNDLEKACPRDILPVTLYQGGINAANGDANQLSSRVSIRDGLPIDWNVTVYNGQIKHVSYYSSDGAYLESVSVEKKHVSLSDLAVAGASYASVTLSKVDSSSDVTPEELDVAVWKPYSGVSHTKLYIGGLNSADGTETNNSRRARSDFMAAKDMLVECSNSVNIQVFQYDSEYEFVEEMSPSWQSGTFSVRKNDGVEFYRFIVAFADDRFIAATSSRHFAVINEAMSNVVTQALPLANVVYDNIDSRYVCIDINRYKTINADIRADKKIHTSNAKSLILPLEHIKSVDIVGNDSQTTFFTMLSSDVYTDNTKPSYASGYDGRIEIAANAEKNAITMPDDAKFLYVALFNASGNDIQPKAIRVLATSDFIYQSIPSSTNSLDGVPYYIANTLKKVDQLKDIEWKALGDVPRNNGTTLVPSGNVATGIPYSSVKEYCKYVGQNVSLLTFMSAARNPYSLMYTENVNASYAHSEYGIEYHGSNCGCYFGAVCSTLIGQALGIEPIWDSAEYVGYLTKIGTMRVVFDQSARGAQVCDVIWQSGHVLMVYSITYDDSGNLENIQTVETGSTFPVVKTYTEQSFNTMLSSGKILLRYVDIYKNTSYEPSEFVHVDGENTVSSYTFNEDVCTFAGDYAAFYTGEEVWINYNLGSTVYTNMVVKKDGVIVDTQPISDGHKISLGNSLDAGFYTVELVLGSITSQPTHFEVVETNVEVEMNGDNASVHFSSSNGAPVYAQICTLNGSNLGMLLLSDDEKTYGNISFNPVALHEAQNPTSQHEGDYYLRVFFNGRYGRVCNEKILLGISNT